MPTPAPRNDPVPVESKSCGDVFCPERKLGSKDTVKSGRNFQALEKAPRVRLTEAEFRVDIRRKPRKFRIYSKTFN